MLEKLQDIEKRFLEIEAQLQDPNVVTNPSELQRLGKARAELEDFVVDIRAYRRVSQELDEAGAMLDDPEMRELAGEEISRLKAEIVRLEGVIKGHLVPKDPNDDKPVIVEIRPAAGGDEAALFAAELFRMYTRYAERAGNMKFSIWKIRASAEFRGSRWRSTPRAPIAS
jgi:peptide chain release factor 1